MDRRKLDELININRALSWWQPDLFVSDILPLLPPELKIISHPPQAAANFNCFIFALGLADNQEIIKESQGFIYDTLVIKWLAENEIYLTEDPKAGDFIIYRDAANYPDSITHIGIYKGNDTVTSKWAWGPVVEHKTLEVPQSYGDQVQYLKYISPSQVELLYQKYKNFNLEPSPKRGF